MKKLINIIFLGSLIACSIGPEKNARLDHVEFGAPLSTNAKSIKTLRDLKNKRQKVIMLFILDSNCRGCISPTTFIGAGQNILFENQVTMVVHYVKDQPKKEIEVKYNNVLFFFDEFNLINHFAPETFQISQLSSPTPRARPIYVYIFFDANLMTWKKKTVYARPLDPAQLKPYLLQ
jgi:hypothetical protein